MVFLELRRILRTFFLLSIVFLMSENPQAGIDPRIKAVSVVTIYGTIGGTLLGLASLSFGAKKRAPLVGASLGLYGGLLFGSYLIIGHAYKSYKGVRPISKDETYYPDTNSLYENVRSGEGGESGVGDVYEYRRNLDSKIFWRKKYQRRFPSIYINFIKIQF